LDHNQIALAIFGLFLAGFVKGAAGIGYSTTALPFLAFAIGIEKAMPLVLVPSIASNLFVMFDAGHFRGMVRRFWPLYVATIPGLIIGLAGLYYVDKQTAAAVLGGVIVVYAIYALAKPTLSLSPKFERPLLAPVGVINGVVNGLTGSQMMPMMPYMLSLRLPPDQLVQATNIAFTLSSLVMMAGLAQIGFLTFEVLVLSCSALIPAFLGVRLGTIIRRRISAETFRKVVLVLLFGLGSSLIILRWV
jgi:uncharacterized membrane protein YfcA